MNGSGYHYLSLCRIRQNQHGVRALRGLCNKPIEFLHFRASADNAAKPLIVLEVPASHPVVGFEPEICGDPL